MPRLSRDEAFRTIDAFDDFIHDLVGQDVVIHRMPGRFTVELLGKRSVQPKRLNDEQVQEEPCTT